MEVIRGLTLGEVRMRGVVAKRRIVHFGLRYAFTSHHLNPAPQIPSEFHPIQNRAAALAGIDPAAFSEVIGNRISTWSRNSLASRRSAVRPHRRHLPCECVPNTLPKASWQHARNVRDRTSS